jgi:transposase InsO family protein
MLSLLFFPIFWTFGKLASSVQGQCLLTILSLVYGYTIHKHLFVLENDAHREFNHNPGSSTDIMPDCFDSVVLPTLFSKATSRDWIPDSGAMSHVTGQEYVFTNLRPPPPNTRVLGVGGATAVTGMGRVSIPITVDGVNKNFVVDDVLYAPGLPFNIISIKKLCLWPNKKPTDLQVSFVGATCEITRRSTDALIAVADADGPNLYKLRLQDLPESQDEKAYATAVIQETDMYTWHRRLGHLKESRLRRVLKDALGIKFPIKETLPRCEPCYRATLRRRNYTTPAKRATRPLERIFMDVGGPISSSKGNNIVMRYWLVIVDDYSRYRWVRLMQHKSDVNSEFKNWKAWAENHFGLKVGACRNDNGGEFTNNMLTMLHQAAGVTIEPTAPYNPEQNGVAERSMLTLLNAVRCILIDANLPEHCYGDVLKTVCTLTNYHPTSANGDETPHHRLFKEYPPLDKLRAIGCECWKSLPHNPSMKKLDERGDQCYLLGYGQGDHQYRVWNADKKRVELVRDLQWEEDIFAPPSAGIPETVFHPGILDQRIVQERINAWTPAVGNKRVALFEGENSTSNTATFTEVPTFITAEGAINEQFRYKDPDTDPVLIASQVEALKAGESGADTIALITALICSMEQHQGKEWLTLPAEVARNLDLLEPKTYAGAMKGLDHEKWKLAVEEETNSLDDNKTWIVTAKPRHQKVLSGKYVFKIKTDSEGNTDRYKARWVVRGFEQEYGVDFHETFASVVKPMSYRVLFAIACILGWEIDQMDVKTAFLYGMIDADVYIELPPNLQDKFPGKVCKLKRALYGLKQAPKIWYDTLCAELRKLGFENINEDYSIFVQKETGVIIGIYVDDLLVIGKDRRAVDNVKKELQQRFQMTDLGPASFYLGIKLTRRWSKWGNQLCLSQRAYVNKILNDFNLTDANPVSTPMEDKPLLPSDSSYQASLELRKWYQSAVGSLMYLMLCTRPDIAYAVSQLSRFSANPTEKHRTAVKHVFRYLKGTIDYGLVFDSSKRDRGLLGYTDANWARDHDRRSTGGYAFMLFGTIITWSSKRQATVALSSCEAEYIAETEAAKEAIWLRRLLGNFGYSGPLAVKILGDNRGALALAKNPEFHSRTKHIDIRYHFVRQKVEEGLVELEWTGTASNVADGMTKPLGSTAFAMFRNAIGIQVVHEEEARR